MNILTKYLNFKLVAILSILFSTLAIEIAFQNPAQGYELSIYGSTPLIVWFSLILSITGALFIVLCQISMNKYISSNFWIIGVFILLLNRLILLYIPYIRGYFSWRGDHISHVGYLIDIITYGHFYKDYYPITHILLSVVNMITGISQNIVSNYSTGIMSIFYVISIYLLAMATLDTKKEQILAVTSIAIVFFSYNVLLMPNGWSQLYSPLIVFLYLKSLEKQNPFEYKLLFVILLIMYPLFHPLSSFYVIFVLTIIGVVTISIDLFSINEKNDMEVISQTKKYAFKEQLVSRFTKYLKTKTNTSILTRNNNYFFPLTAILVEIVIIIPWILSFQNFNLNINIFYNSILTSTSQDVIEGMQNSLNKVDVSGIDFIQLLVKTEGCNLIFIGLSVVSLFILGKKGCDSQKSKNLLILLIITIFTGLVYAAYLFGIVPGLQAIAAGRIKSYVMLFTPISAGFVFTHFFRKKLIVKKVNIFPMLCMFIILTASMLSVSSLYNSPNVVRPNPSITQMDMTGTDWFVNYHNKEILTTTIMSPVHLFMDGIIGRVEEKKIFGSPYRHTTVPDHFNYTNMSKLGKSYLEDRYMMVTKFDTVIYSTVWSKVGRFNYQDFDRLSGDTSVEKLYSNGETEIFFIHTMRVS